MRRSNKKINLIILDIDGVIFTDDNCLNITLLPQWLVKQHQAFLYSEEQRIRDEGFNEVILAYGSDRQDANIDDERSLHYKTLSCTLVLPIIQHYLQIQLPEIKIYIDPFWMSDIYGERQVGENYLTQLKRQLPTAKVENNNNDNALIDDSKISLLYTLCHRTALLNPGANLVVDFIDNTVTSATIKSLYSKNPSLPLLPKVDLRIHHKDPKTYLRNDEIIDIPHQAVDKQYSWTVHALVDAPLICIYEKDGSCKESTPLELLRQSKSKKLSIKSTFSPERRELLIPSTLETDHLEWIKRLQQETSQLAEDPKYSKRHYYTADQLVKEGHLHVCYIQILPQEFMEWEKKSTKQDPVISGNPGSIDDYWWSNYNQSTEQDQSISAHSDTPGSNIDYWGFNGRQGSYSSSLPPSQDWRERNKGTIIAVGLTVGALVTLAGIVVLTSGVTTGICAVALSVVKVMSFGCKTSLAGTLAAGIVSGIGASALTTVCLGLYSGAKSLKKENEHSYSPLGDEHKQSVSP